jgi:hypothetical protein
MACRVRPSAHFILHKTLNFMSVAFCLNHSHKQYLRLRQQVKSYYDRRSVGQSVCLGVRQPSRTRNQFSLLISLILCRQLRIILLSQFFRLPQPGGPGPCIYFPQLHRRALCLSIYIYYSSFSPGSLEHIMPHEGLFRLQDMFNHLNDQMPHHRQV